MPATNGANVRTIGTNLARTIARPPCFAKYRSVFPMYSCEQVSATSGDDGDYDSP